MSVRPRLGGAVPEESMRTACRRLDLIPRAKYNGRRLMIDRSSINEHLERTACYNCGKSLKGAEIMPISELPVALIAHVACPYCAAESMITITIAGSGTVPVVSDLSGAEVNKFISAKSATIDELLDLHKMLKRKSVCKLLHSQGNTLAKKTKRLEDKKAYRL